MPQSLCLREKEPPRPIGEEAGWAADPIWATYGRGYSCTSENIYAPNKVGDNYIMGTLLFI
jgi:hypothetical protein